MVREIKELTMILEAIKIVRERWILNKDQEDFTKLLTLYGCLGESSERYEKALKQEENR